jgi:hypothetical protein
MLYLQRRLLSGDSRLLPLDKTSSHAGHFNLNTLWLSQQQTPEPSPKEPTIWATTLIRSGTEKASSPTSQHLIDICLLAP